MAFAELSGDYNPLHLDGIISRRTLFGRQIVHGIHALLWALDTWLAQQIEPIELRALEAEFREGIGVGEGVNALYGFEECNSVTLKILAGGAEAADIRAVFTPSKDRRAVTVEKRRPLRGQCKVLCPDNATSVKGDMDLCLDTDLAATLFPNALRILPPIQIAEVLATTRMVGMECPGLYSMYSELDLTFSPVDSTSAVFSYHVNRIDPRFSLLWIKVEAPGLAGTVKAFFLPPPKLQAGFGEIRKKVEPGEFLGQNALVVGGTRGLGEVTAKLLCAGGARVKLTYHRGAGDAQRVVEDITEGNGEASCLKFNVLGSPGDLSDRLGKEWVPSHLYYFATPPIFAGKRGLFSSPLFQKFCKYYVEGFLNTVNALCALGPEPRVILYPSTVAIEEMPLNMGEYVAAKAAGENLCVFLEKTRSNITIHRPRLPRLATDQTASLVPVRNLDPVSFLLRVLRQMSMR
jgi:hypothetical protein